MSLRKAFLLIAVGAMMLSTGPRAPIAAEAEPYAYSAEAEPYAYFKVRLQYRDENGVWHTWCEWEPCYMGCCTT